MWKSVDDLLVKHQLFANLNGFVTMLLMVLDVTLHPVVLDHRNQNRSRSVDPCQEIPQPLDAPFSPLQHSDLLDQTSEAYYKTNLSVKGSVVREGELTRLIVYFSDVRQFDPFNIGLLC